MWLLGLIIRDGCYDGKVSVSLGVDECDIVERYKDILKKYVLHKSSDVKIIEQDRKEKGHYYDVNIIGEVKKYSERFLKIFSGLKKEERKIPDFIFTADKESKYAFLAGMIDADGYINNHNNTKSFCTVQIGSTNKEMSIQTGMLAQSLGFDVFIYENRYKKHTKLIRYAVEFKPDKHIIEHLASDKKKKHFIPNTTSVNNEYATVKNVEYIGFRDEYSYDVETESDTFVVSGIASHNCRTAMSEDRHGLDCLDGRGNVSPVTINLPKIALKHRMDLQAGYDINGFFKELKEVINVAVAALVERFEWQGKQLAKSAPFIYENGVLKGKKLDPNDNVREVLKHGSLALGYIGLSNALVALTGKHHGESKDVLDLGLRIIEMLDDAAKEASEKYDLNFSVYATPAEGLCDKWAKALRKEFGVVEGVTDRDYINNSHHVPVYHKCSIKEKLDIEQKFAKYATGGNITYVELDGNARTNLKALEEIIDYAMKIGIPYLALNHPIDECSNCGYEGIIGDHCPKCGKKDGDTYIKRLRRVN